jgi:hypothetical protein
MTSVPEITRMIARIEDWKERRGKARGRADTDRVLGEAQKLFDELSDMLTGGSCWTAAGSSGDSSTRRVAGSACGPRRLCAMLDTTEPLSSVISLWRMASEPDPCS